MELQEPIWYKILLTFMASEIEKQQQADEEERIYGIFVRSKWL